MTEPRTLAAEFALRLLEGEELLEARRLLASDGVFSAEVAWWEDKFGALYDEIEDEEPSPDLWQRIAARLDQPSATLFTLKRQVKLWRTATVAAAAAAAILLGLQLRPQPVIEAPGPVSTQAAPILVASLVGEEAPEALTVAFRSDTRQLVISPARIVAPTDRDRQLWLIAEGRQPVSLGLVEGQRVQRRVVPAPVAALFARGATIALSDEPTGGSPTGQPTGSVLAAGGLDTI